MYTGKHLLSKRISTACQTFEAHHMNGREHAHSHVAAHVDIEALMSWQMRPQEIQEVGKLRRRLTFELESCLHINASRESAFVCGYRSARSCGLGTEHGDAPMQVYADTLR